MLGRATVYVLGAFLIAGLAWWGVQQYGNTRAISEKANVLTEVISEASVESKARVRADYQAQVKKAVLLDSVRPAYAITREKYNERVEKGTGCALDPAWVGVFNNAVRASNAAVESASDMSGAL